MSESARPRSETFPKAPGFWLGLGLGGFLDGIVLHQVLQWHHLLSDTTDHPTSTIQGLEANTLADGLFHLATWVFVIVGMALTVRAWQQRQLAPPWIGHAGMLLVGWGVFNVVEGVIDHQILQIHHVRDDLGGPLAWDLGFLIFGALLVLLGAAMVEGSAPVRAVRGSDGRGRWARGWQSSPP